MKSIKLTLAAILFAIALPLSSAHAQLSVNTDPYAAFYPVSSIGSSTADFTFSAGSLPYLYIDLPTNATSQYITITSALNASNFTNIYYVPVTSSTNPVWLPLSEIPNAGVNSIGTWDITGTSYVPNGIGGNTSYGGLTQLQYGANVHINSAPEPMGTVLFLLGGSIMAIFLIRRKKVLAIA